MPNRYERAYANLEKLFQRPLADLQPGDCFKLKADGFMDLSCEVLPNCQETGATVVSICHYFVMNGDLCQDPEMVLRLFAPGRREYLHLAPSTDPALGRAEALMYQQSIPPVYDVVYPRPGQYSPKIRESLNQFLAFWLGNLKAQGHRPEEPS